MTSRISQIALDHTNYAINLWLTESQGLPINVAINRLGLILAVTIEQALTEERDAVLRLVAAQPESGKLTQAINARATEPDPAPGSPAASELEQAFTEQMRGLHSVTEPTIRLALTPFQAFAIISMVQLACRHPANRGATRECAVGVAGGMEAQLAAFGEAIKDVLAMGWDSRYDVEQGDAR